MQFLCFILNPLPNHTFWSISYRKSLQTTIKIIRFERYFSRRLKTIALKGEIAQIEKCFLFSNWFFKLSATTHKILLFGKGLNNWRAYYRYVEIVNCEQRWKILLFVEGFNDLMAYVLKFKLANGTFTTRAPWGRALIRPTRIFPELTLKIYLKPMTFFVSCWNAMATVFYVPAFYTASLVFKAANVFKL